MKKTVCLILALCLTLTAVAAFAQTVTSRNGRFTYDLPEGYVQMDAAAVRALMADEASMRQFANNAEDVSLDSIKTDLSYMLTDVETNKFDVVFSADYHEHMSITTIEDGDLTVSILLEEISKETGATYSKTPTKFGTNSFYVLNHKMDGIEWKTYAIAPAAGHPIMLIEAEVMEQEALEHILSTFAFK